MVETNPSDAQVESLEFQADVQQLLNILSRSLYVVKEIFLRELISNASDALHRIQFEMLTNRDVLDPDVELAIHVDFDEEAKTLTVSDSGIGMSKEDLVQNLGTIAHSGAMAFLKNLEEGQRPADIIGQFGVGFYAVFMVADEVRVTSRSHEPNAQSWTWISRGDNVYTIQPAEKADRGTTVEVLLGEDDGEFASKWRIDQIVKKHSDFVSFPIYVADTVANQQTALWRKSPGQVDEEEHANFYRQLTLDFEPPLSYVHMVVDAPVDIRSVLYVPRQRERGVFRARTDHGLKLYSKKVLIQEHNKELLPEYFNFVEGVVDSEDIPLNISRETVQSNQAVRQIRKALTGRLTKALSSLADEKPDDYALFWKEFGVFLKGGIATTPRDKDELLPLLRFHSSQADDGLTSFDEYAARMSDEQKAIYYIVGDELDSVARSPHLDYFRAHGLEVLYLVDPIDGFVMSSLREYDEKPLQNVDDAGLELPTEEEPGDSKEEGVPQPEFHKLTSRFKQVLGDRVTEVRASRVLEDSPCRLVSPEGGANRDLQRMQRLLGEHVEIPAMILEINRGHRLIRDLARLIKGQDDDTRIDLTIQQLFENVLLLEGLHPNPAQMVPRLQSLLEAALEGQQGPTSE